MALRDAPIKERQEAEKSVQELRTTLAELTAAALRGLVTIRRVFVGSRASFEAINRVIAQHRLKPVVDRVFAFDDGREAYEHFEAKRHVGKVVIADS